MSKIPEIFGWCPECSFLMRLRNPTRGEVFNCDECGSGLEVVGIVGDSVEFDVASVIQEDWGE